MPRRPSLVRPGPIFGACSPSGRTTARRSAWGSPLRSPVTSRSRQPLGDVAVGKIVGRYALVGGRVADRWPATRQHALLLAVLVVEELLERLVRFGDRRLDVTTGDGDHDRHTDDLTRFGDRDHQRTVIADARFRTDDDGSCQALGERRRSFWALPD